MRGGGLDERPGHAPPAVGAVHEEAGDGPHRGLVDGREVPRARQPHVGRSRLDRDRADRPGRVVGQEPGHVALLDVATEGDPVPLPLAGAEGPRREAPPHAPAAARGAVRAEEALEIREPLGGEGDDWEPGRGRRAGGHAGHAIPPRAAQARRGAARPERAGKARPGRRRHLTPAPAGTDRPPPRPARRCGPGPGPTRGAP